MEKLNLTKGSLFTHDYLWEAIRDEDAYKAVDIAALSDKLRAIFKKFPTQQEPSEARTEDEIIWPILGVLGWTESIRQQNLSPKGRDDVPDGLLFLNHAVKQKADEHKEPWKRYEHGVVVVESKRWRRPLDRGLTKKDEVTAPSTQMLRYLRVIDNSTNGALRWGFLTNGSVWRLYYQGARSVSEQFFEVDLAGLLQIRDDLLESDNSEQATSERGHLLRIFALVFCQASFVPTTTDLRTFHQRAIEAGRFYEERVAENLSNVVFHTVFPLLAKAIADNHKTADLQGIRQAALVMLYRLLFLLYAEDRNLLPVNEARYDDYGLRSRVREDIASRKDLNDVFSDTQDRYWSAIDGLSRAVDKGDKSIGLPPYNGGLFNREATPLLQNIHIPDDIMAQIIDLLGSERRDGKRYYINYRDLSVQQLGSIYERLLEFELKRDADGGLLVHPNLFARKSSGSYYTPHDLVDLIIGETLEPLISDKINDFKELAKDDGGSEEDKMAALRHIDPAEAILTLRVCDPAMGSGHFLVNLVDHLSETVIETLAEVNALVDWTEEPYVSPLVGRITGIRDTILKNAKSNGWSVDQEQLDDKHIIRRMVLKRCIYGVDKNEMAVELAKVSLWLHTFTVGAPLSFLDHHLRCGDSLFGEWVEPLLEAVNKGRPLLMKPSVDEALGSAASMQTIEGLTDAEISEAHRSSQIFNGVKSMTRPLNSFMTLWHALRWVSLPVDKEVINTWLDGEFGNPIDIAMGKIIIKVPKERDASLALGAGKPKKQRLSAHQQGERFVALHAAASELIAEERFLNWEIAFPGVWSNWEKDRTGGFDAIIGNPPWERIKLQEVEWFGLRDRKIALAPKAADRKKMVTALKDTGDPLFADYTKAKTRAENMIRMAQKLGDYPLLSGGDINLYSLFVERSMALLNDQGVMGLLTPSGIASDKTASKFFKSLTTSGRLKCLYDFENRRTRYNLPPFFPDVDSRFKFTATIASQSRPFKETKCAFFLQARDEIKDPNRCFPLTAEDFSRMNPNTGTAPILRSKRDAELTKAIYSRLPVLVNRSADAPVSAWPVKYERMFDMTNDSSKFRTQSELETQEGAFHLGGNIWQSDKGRWLPLYVGRMIHQFDHRASSVVVNEANIHNAALSGDVSDEDKGNPNFSPTPQYWVNEGELNLKAETSYLLGFRDIARATDARTMIAALLPATAVGNTAPVLLSISNGTNAAATTLMLGNLNALILDYVLRQKAQSTHVNWYIAEQLPVVALDTYQTVKFGAKSAADLIKAIVLELTYTAHDMAPFAKDMGYVDEKGDVLAPFAWDEYRRLRLRAKLDAIFFHLYGIFDADNRAQSRDDITYIYASFPIIARQEQTKYGRYLSCDLALAYCNTLSSGQPDAEPEV